MKTMDGKNDECESVLRTLIMEMINVNVKVF